MFFGPRLGTVFASRWKAAMWSAMVLMTAYCSMPAAEEAQKAAEHKAEVASTAHKSPWATDPK
jgi:hypothetical protein